MNTPPEKTPNKYSPEQLKAMPEVDRKKVLAAQAKRERKRKRKV